MDIHIDCVEKSAVFVLVKVGAQCSHPRDFFRLSTGSLGGCSPIWGRRYSCSGDVGTIVFDQILLNPDVLDEMKTNKKSEAGFRFKISSLPVLKTRFKKQHPAAIEFLSFP